MIGVSEERDPAGIKLMRRAGLNPDQYIAITNKETYLDAMNWKTGENVRLARQMRASCRLTQKMTHLITRCAKSPMPCIRTTTMDSIAWQQTTFKAFALFFNTAGGIYRACNRY